MPETETNNTTSEILQAFEEWAGKSAHSSRFFEFYLNLLKIQADAEKQIGLPPARLSIEDISHRVRSGKPVLEFENIEIDWDIARAVFKQLVQLFGQNADIMADIAVPELSEVELDRKWLKGWMDEGEIDAGDGKAPMDPVLLATLAHHTMRPFLTGYALVYGYLLDQDFWRRGDCPICGHYPAFSYLEKELGARWLICSCCNMYWLFQRLDCPFCRNVDQSTLSYRTDEDGVYRLYLCEKCRHYLKAIDLRKTDRPVKLSLEMLTTAGLDQQAMALGYTSATTPEKKI